MLNDIDNNHSHIIQMMVDK